MMQQHMKALQRANEVRQAKAEVRAGIESGRRSLADLLDDPPEVCAKVPIGELLEWAPGVGHFRAMRLLQDDCRRRIVGETLALGQIGEYSRGLIAANLRRMSMRVAA